MTTMLYAQPYDIEATGFYLESAEQYAEKAAKNVNRYGMPVEEYEIQFIHGDPLDAALADAVGLHQGDIPAFFRRIAEWEDHQKRAVIVAAGECGCSVGWDDDPDDLDVDLYQVENLRELASEFVEEGLFGDIPERLQFYIDLDAIARDLGMDYSETTIAGESLVYRCG